MLATWQDLQKEAGEADKEMKIKFSLSKYLLSIYYRPGCSRYSTGQSTSKNEIIELSHGASIFLLESKIKNKHTDGGS